MLTVETYPNGIILIKDDKGNKMRYIGYTLSESKRAFKHWVKSNNK